jgi:thiamine biosynthesis lipoprotein
MRNAEPPNAGPDAFAFRMERSGCDFLFTFQAMASPCEVRLETDDASLAQAVGRAVQAEARRIEEKFSRYRSDSVVGRINEAEGRQIVVDAETSHLLDFAAQCFDISGGLFDITSGVLRRIWRFDGSDRIPDNTQIAASRRLVGWQKVSWKSPSIVLPLGMEIDLGGLGKEYAVDKAFDVARAITRLPVLVNFGGDLRVSGPRKSGARWKVAIESVDKNDQLAGMLELADGALATSGDSRRFVLKGGIRYGHILNPRTGRPVKHTPRSVTVAAPTCIEAGMFSTLAMLNGRNAEKFLKREGLHAWCIR